MAAKRKKKKTTKTRRQAAGVYGSLASVKRALRQAVPTRYPVRVYIRELEPDLAGDCDLVEDEFGEKRFVIRLNSKVDETAKVLMLVHEWSHAVSWFSPGPDHGKAWGQAYARCYRTIGAP